MTLSRAPLREAQAVAGHATPALGAGAWVRGVGVGAAAALLALRAVAPDLLDSLALPLAVTGILIGVPHGAVDHLVPFWSTGRRITPVALARGVTAYVAVLAAALACVLLLPVATLWAFLVLSALHFGRGEVVVSAELAGRRDPRLNEDLLLVLAHGCVTVALPVALWSSTSLPVLDSVAPGFAGTPQLLLHSVLACSALLIVTTVVRLVHSGRLTEAGELVLLAALFALVTPLAAFGVYFGLWHAARHTLRLVWLPDSRGRRDLRAGTLRYLRGAALPTAAALGLLVLLWRTNGTTVLAAQLATLVALTAPHLGVVAALDRRGRA